MALQDFSLATDGLPADVMITPTHLDFGMKPAADNATRDIVMPGLKITALPGAMRKMGWDVSAALMERWFDSPPWRMPELWKAQDERSTIPPATQIDAPYVDETIVTMDWALRFKRCRKAHEEVMRRVANPAAVKLLNKRLTDAEWNRTTRKALGARNMSARELDESCQVNAKPFGSAISTLDDAYGALGSATMKVAVIGQASIDPLDGRASFHIEAAGTYIRDFYDFNGNQFLGLWTADRVINKKELIAHAALNMHVIEWMGDRVGLVTNQSFDAYRSRNNRGGDFVIFSDVHWTPLNISIDLGVPE